MEKITDRITNLETSLEKMTSAVEKLISKMEEKTEIPIIAVETPKISSQTTSTISSGVNDKYPIPMEYREIISSILNHSFGVSLEPLTDRPAFSLIVVVPDKYSNIKADEKDVCKVDIRSKVITYAEGVNGVRVWAEQIANNLGPEIRAQIIADRALLQ